MSRIHKDIEADPGNWIVEERIYQQSKEIRKKKTSIPDLPDGYMESFNMILERHEAKPEEIRKKQD